MSTLFMTVPTAGAHPDILEELVSNCGLPRSQIVIVVTREGANIPDGCIVLEDYSAPNIQRWWLMGIEEAARRGASCVAVINDDIRVTPHTLHELHSAPVRTGATVASPSRPPRKDGVHKGRLVPYSPRIWGCLWLVDVASTLRPDPRYVWWYGDSDLDIRARRDFDGIVTVPVEYEHYFPGEGTGRSAELTAQTELDAVTFGNDYARLLTLSRLVGAPARMWARVTGHRQG